jgi:PAS domain S-box-containing protein
MGKCGTWFNRTVERGRHLLTGKIRTKLLVAFLGVALCPLAMISYRDAEVTRNALTASAYQALFAAASQTALRLDTFIAATANVIGTQAHMPPLGEYLSLPAADQEPAEKRIVDILQAFAQKNPAFTASVAVLDVHGRIVLDTQPANVDLDESATDSFRIALETGLPHASRLDFSASDGKPYLHFSSVVHAPDGRPVGVLRERYSAAVVQQMVAENNRLVSPQSFALVLNEDGLLLADGHLSPGQLSDGLFKATRPLDLARVSALRTRRLLPREFAQDIVLHFPGLAGGLEKAGQPAPYFTLQLSNNRGPQYAAAVIPMKTQPWMVVFLQPQDVFLAPVRTQTRHTVLLALGTVGAVAATAIGVAQLLTGPIIRLMAVAQQVAEGNFGGKVLVRSRDEIGALANAFNRMTERLTATLEGLRQSEENYRGTYENAFEGIWRVSPDGRVLSANPAMARILGYASPDELVASVSDIGRQLYVHPQERHGLLLTYAEGAAIVGRELEFYRKDGQRIWVLTSGRPVHDEAGHLLFVEGFVTNITRRKRAEEELRRSEAYLTEAQRLSHTGSFGWHVASGEIYWSDETFRIFAYDRAHTPTAEFVLQRTHPEDRAFVQHIIDRAAQERKDFDCEHRLLMPDGSVKYLQVVAHAIERAASGDLEFVGAVMDITERKRAEEALHEAQAELVHVTRVATLGELAASIAHEINQPLGAVVNNASACVRWLAAQNTEEARRSAALVIADGHRAADIIGRIRALAKRVPPHKDWLDLNATIRDVIALARSEVQRNSIVLETHLAEDVPRILGDRIQLQQVLLNLVMNAIEAMSGVEAGPRALRVSSEPVAATEVVITVRDSGPGFEAQHFERLFEAFYTTKPHGLGLGLAISRRIIEAHGGRLWATANAPQGAVVQFTMPMGSEEGA